MPALPRLCSGSALPRRALRWTDRASLRVSGELLLAEVGGARLAVPGGASLAPPSTRAESATALRRSADGRLLARLPETVRRAARPGALDGPRFVEEMERTAAALAQARRWDDLLRLTAPLERSERPPAELARLRAETLEEMGRTQEALDLLVRLVTDAESARSHPRTHFQLARLCAAHDRPDLAVGVLQRLRKLHPFPGLERYIRRFQLDVDLEEGYETYESTHFRLRHATGVGQGQAILVAGLLEGEIERLQQWIPFDEASERVEVHLVPAEDFYRVYGGGVGILGLYDGRIRLPVFEIGKESAVMTEVASHELAHALIDRHTKDRAPKWFHEGLAQLVEPETEQRNPYRGGRRVITFPLLEPVLRGFNESQFAGLAYEEAYWTLRFVEERHGKGGIRRLLDAFARHATGEEALRSALSQPPAAFDRALQQWARSSEAPLRAEGLELDYDDAKIERIAEHTPGLRQEIERQVAESEGPKVGLAIEGETPQEQMETLQRRVEDEIVDTVQTWMEGWYEVYRSMADSIRTDLRQVVLAMRGVERPERRVELICRDLTFQLSPMIGRGVETIDDDVTRSLRAAYTELSKVASACSRGRGFSGSMERAERHLKEAAYHLEKYGMRP